MKFDSLLTRADDETMQELLGRPILRLLNLLDSSLVTPKQLREVLRSFRDPRDLLRDVSTRALLIDLLRPQEADDLSGRLDLPIGNPFEQLKLKRFRRGSSVEDVLHAYFELDEVEDDQDVAAPASRNAEVTYGLFEHQRDAVLRCNQKLERSPHRVLLHMPTGAGKTRTSMHLITQELRRSASGVVVWLAYSDELCEQAASEFERAWRSHGDRDVEIMRYWGDRDLSISQIRDGFLVAGLSKMYAAAKRDPDFVLRLADRASMVVIDEAHQAVAPTFQTVLELLVDRHTETRLVGLTATPGRTWNDPETDRKLAEFFGTQKVTLDIGGYANPVDFLVDEGFLSRTSFEALEYTSTQPLSDLELHKLSEALDVPDMLLDRLAEDEQRNLVVLAKVEQLARAHQRILVFAASVQHAKMLSSVLQARGIHSFAVTSATPVEQRRNIIKRFKSARSEPIVLCNYGVLTAGFDAPRVSAAVIARPTKSLVLFSQMVGRATRGIRAGGNERSLVVTVVDTNLPGFGGIAEAFHNWEDIWGNQQ